MAGGCEYTDRDEVEQIEEYAFGPGFFTVEFDYDNRGRLTHERRYPAGGFDVYNLTYEYDQGGNRTGKIDSVNNREVVYNYDIDGPSVYGSDNNRLMYYKTLDIGVIPPEPLSTTYYYYSDAGNVMRIVTNEEGSDHYTATRFGYAQNGQAVTYILGEEWDDGDPCPINYNITYAREFRYDEARARYLNRVLEAEWIEYGYFIVDTETWSDYDGDDIYGDFEVVGGNVTNLRSFEPGIGKVDPWAGAGSASTSYYHANLIGTTRLMSNSAGSPVENVSYTAFGERIEGTNHRYGYAGAWGYQAHDFPDGPGDDPIPFLHVGHRYYDPSSGRFLQRDPIGIRGGLNVYVYTEANPVLSIDPTGLGWLKRIWDNVVKIAKKIAGKLTGKASPPVSAPIVPVVTAVGGGPDVVRIWVGCGHRAKSLRDGSSADDMLDRYERGHGKYVKPRSEL